MDQNKDIRSTSVPASFNSNKPRARVRVGAEKSTCDAGLRAPRRHRSVTKPVTRVQSNVTKDASKVFQEFVKLQRSRSQNDAEKNLSVRISRQDDSEADYVYAWSRHDMVTDGGDAAQHIPGATGGEPASFQDPAGRGIDRTPYEEIGSAAMTPHSLLNSIDEIDGGSGVKMNNISGVGTVSARSRDFTGVDHQLAVDHRKRHPSMGISTLADESICASGSEYQQDDVTAAGAAARAGGRKKKSAFQWARERVAAAYRRLHRSDSTASPRGRQDDQDRTSSSSKKSWRSSFDKKKNYSVSSSALSDVRTGTAVDAEASSSDYGMNRTLSFESRSQTGSTGTNLSRKKSKTSSNKELEQRPSRLFSGIQRRLSSVRIKSPTSKEGKPRPRSAEEQLFIRELNGRERQVLDRYTTTSTTDRVQVSRPSSTNQIPVSPPNFTDVGRAALSPDDMLHMRTSSEAAHLSARRHLRLEGLVSHNSPRSRVDGAGRGPGVVRLASGEDTGSSEGDEIDGRRMIAGHSLQQEPERRTKRFSERTDEEKNEAYVHCATKLSQIAAELNLTDSPCCDNPTSISSMIKMILGFGGGTETEVEDLNEQTVAGASAAAVPEANFLERLVTAVRAHGLHDLHIHPYVNNESVVTQIALLFSLTSEVIRLVGDSSPTAHDITEMAMQYFDENLAQAVDGDGGLEAVVGGRSDSQISGSSV